MENEEGRKEYLVFPPSKNQCPASSQKGRKIPLKGNGRRIDYILYSDEGLQQDWKLVWFYKTPFWYNMLLCCPLNDLKLKPEMFHTFYPTTVSNMTAFSNRTECRSFVLWGFQGQWKVKKIWSCRTQISFKFGVMSWLNESNKNVYKKRVLLNLSGLFSLKI